MIPECKVFVDGWKHDEAGVRPLFLAAYALLEELGASLSYRERPGVSASLRAARPGQQGRELFALIDIIDDDPQRRWLSVCFYADETSDPEERGDVVPAGLAGEDARCFDVDGESPPALRAYLLARLHEAFLHGAEK